jgi:GNAT superfamily N-acetyltransferase
MNILHAMSEAEIAACFPVIKVLRPHLVDAEFIPRVLRQQSQGYRLCYLRDAGIVVAAAGYRLLEFLAWGRVLYVDDLATLQEKQGSGYGGALVDWLIKQAREQSCDELHLDSGYQRHTAHRLYLGRGLKLSSHHFSMKLKPESGNVSQHDDARIGEQ